MSMSQSVRKASRMDQWYPKQPQLQEMLENVYKDNIDNEIKFIIAPHAGLTYCVETQGAVFSKVNLINYNLIIILGVTHAFNCRDLCASPYTQWQNPIDNQLPLQVHSSSFTKVSPDDDSSEHSIEILIPFLSLLMKKQNKQLSILPLYVGSEPSSANIEKLKQVQKEQNVLIIISSDFCHFGKRFGYAPKIDQLTTDQVVDSVNKQVIDGIIKSRQEFLKAMESTQNTVCGRFSISAGLAVVGNYSAELLSYTKSSILKNFNDSSVSYAGIVGK